VNFEVEQVDITVDMGELDLLEERAKAISRISQRLGRILEEVKELDGELDRFELLHWLPGLSSEARHDIQLDIDLSTDAYNNLREAAACAFRQLVHHRERCGFHSHELLRRCYSIPEMRLPVDFSEEVMGDVEAG